MQIWVICRYSNPSGISGFYGFPCRDASLRNEGFLPGADLPKLASKHDGTRKKQRANPLHHGKGFYCFCQKGIHVVSDLLRTAFASFAAWRENHSRGNRMGINPTPTAAECCKYLSISGLRRF